MTETATSHGKLTGAKENGVFSFKGIPFAAPISGENRWLPPQPLQPWSGVRDATRFGDVCPQQGSLPMWLAGGAGKKFLQAIDVPGTRSDDCLNLNVWTPTLDPNAKLPVMFYVHGGAFVSGANNLPIYDGAYLANKGVVFVSINYRVGLMGSFVAPGMFDDEFCGPNRGFEDQLAGLKWVHENIANFGGDPEQVTIFGESAGGQSVSVLLASPKTQKYFKRAIAQSGAPDFCAPVALHDQFSKDLLDGLGIQPGDRSAMANLTGDDTVKAMRIAQKLLGKKDARDRYGDLVIYGNLGGVHGTEFLPHHILDALQQGVARDKDFIIGTVKEDGRLFQLAMPGPEWLSSRLAVGFIKNMVKPGSDLKTAFARYKQAMPGRSDAYVRGQMVTDIVWRRGSIRAAEAQASAAPGRTYLYQFDWTSPVPGIGAVHGLDLAFTLGNLEPFAGILGDLEPLKELADTISDAWVNFAKTGQPVANMPEWKPFDPQERATMVFDKEIALKHNIDPHLSELWDIWWTR